MPFNQIEWEWTKIKQTPTHRDATINFLEKKPQKRNTRNAYKKPNFLNTKNTYKRYQISCSSYEVSENELKIKQLPTHINENTCMNIQHIYIYTCSLDWKREGEANITHVKNHNQCSQPVIYWQGPNRESIMKMRHPNRNISSVILCTDSPPD